MGKWAESEIKRLNGDMADIPLTEVFAERTADPGPNVTVGGIPQMEYLC